MPKYVLAAFALLTFAFMLAACELEALPPGGLTPSVQPTEVVDAPTPTPSATLTPEPQLESPTATITAGPPTATDTPSPTPDPYATYVIQPNDTLIGIIRIFGHRDLGVIDEIIRINQNVISADRLPGAGSVITIPLPTATATPEDFALTETAQGATPVIQLPVDTEIIQVTVREGQTIVGIAEENATTLVIVATLNPQIGFFNCDFTNPSGGPDCLVSLQIGQPVNVPALTPTPTLSPTFSGNETATPTPTFEAPIAFYPQQNAVAPPITFALQWASVGILQANEVYLIEVQDDTTGTQHIDVTRNTSYQLPESLIPTDGQTHTIRWRVTVAARNAEGRYAYVSGMPDWRTFQWQSR